MHGNDGDVDRIVDLASDARDARERLVESSNVNGSAPLPARDSPGGVSEGGETHGAPEGGETDGVRIAGTRVTDPEEAALVAARDGLGPVVALYVEARTGDDWVRFSEADMARLHRATNDWLAVFARCRGVDVDPDVTVREAAEVLIDTHDITDVAALLTGVHRL